MRTEWVEEALHLRFAEHFREGSPLANRVALHRAGERLSDRTERLVWPRILSVARSDVGRLGDELELYTVEVLCVVAEAPKGRAPTLSQITDVAREMVDSNMRAGATKIMNEKNEEVGVLDFGPAQESRTYGGSVQIGGVTLSGVDSAVLRSDCIVSPVKPRIR